MRRDVSLHSVEELVLRGLPDVFSTAFERLIVLIYTDKARLAGLGSGKSEVDLPGVGKGSGGLGAVRSETPDIRSVHRTPGGGGASGGGDVPLRSEVALRYKSTVDRKLRRMGREIRYFVDGLERRGPRGGGMTGVAKPMRKCVGKCKKFGDADWVYCPWCGGPMSELD